jgi:O-antigen ligase
MNRWFLLALILVSFAAVLATGRRSGTLVMLIGLAALLLFAFPRRPILVSYAAIAVTVLGAVYTAAYWNQEYGALAQPARAIRSQIDPSERDESSDVYREIERYDLEQTIRDNRLFGVGFGRPFVQYKLLPNLTSFWPLQLYTPHQNVLWLWLKVGFLGISVVLAAFAIALRRCLTVIREQATMDDRWQTAAIVASGLLMYLTFATVDVIFPATRGMVVLGVLFALAFGLMPTRSPGAAHETR